MSDFPYRIVCVDDDIKTRKQVREALEATDHDVILVTCGGGEELLDRLQELQPSLIIMDLLMPDMNGPDILDALHRHKHGKDVRVIFLTAHEKILMVDDYKSLGVIGVIKKPFDPKTFAEEIQELWAVETGEASNP